MYGTYLREHVIANHSITSEQRQNEPGPSVGAVIKVYCLVAVHWQELDKCTLVAFNCLLRTGELLQLRIADTMMNNLLTFANVDLPDTIGIMDSVSAATALLRLIARFIQTTAKQFKCLKLFADA